MKGCVGLIVTLSAVLSALLPVSAVGGSASPVQSREAALLGCWQCQKAGAMAALIFHSPNHLSQDGQHYQYMLIPGAIRVFEGYEFADYYYQTDGRQLAAVYPDGSRIYCLRSDCSSLVTTGNQSKGRGSGGQASGSYNNEVVTPSFGGGSWETEGDRQYHDDSAGYGGGAIDNPTSNYYDYND
jgi:hypothetical protein